MVITHYTYVLKNSKKTEYEKMHYYGKKMVENTVVSHSIYQWFFMTFLIITVKYEIGYY